MNRILLLLTFLLFLTYIAKTQDSVEANFTAGNTAFEQKKYANVMPLPNRNKTNYIRSHSKKTKNLIINRNII